MGTEQDAILAAVNAVGGKVDGVADELVEVKGAVDLIRTKGPLRCDQGDAMREDVAELQKDKMIRDHDALRAETPEPVPPKNTTAVEIDGPLGVKAKLTGRAADKFMSCFSETNLRKSAYIGAIVTVLWWHFIPDYRPAFLIKAIKAAIAERLMASADGVNP